MKCNLLILITVNWRTTGSVNLIIWTKKKVLNLQFSIISPLCACMNTCILRTVVFVFIEKYCIYGFHCRYKIQYFIFFFERYSACYSCHPLPFFIQTWPLGLVCFLKLAIRLCSIWLFKKNNLQSVNEMTSRKTI